MDREQSLRQFVDWWQRNIKGDEKGEAQIFLDHLFMAFGYEDGLKGALADPEKRIKFTLEERHSTRFADLVITGRVLVEMKKRGEDLGKHLLQALDYWKYLTPHPRYIVLCNFDEFWIYDVERQVDAPMGKVPVARLGDDWGPLAFLFPEPEKPVFNREFDLVELTQQAASSLSKVFVSLTSDGRDITRDQAQRFVLQCMVALFAEDIGLLQRYTFTRVIEDCQQGAADPYDLIPMLFMAMNRPGFERAGRFFKVDYFDGGVFRQIDHVPLDPPELDMLREAANHNWARVRPAIFGAIFESSMAADERHQIGAHFTSEVDILRIVDPVIVKPWLEQINAAQTPNDLRALHTALCRYQVLDPACGSGNFLYMAYREIKRLEKRIFDRAEEMGESLIPQTPPPDPLPVHGEGEQSKRKLTARAEYVGPPNPFALPERPVYPDMPLVSTRQFWGFDVKDFAVELAKVTLMIAKKLAIDELGLPEHALPLDNLDNNIRCVDALFEPWPDFDACIGNPPYMGAKRLKQEHPPEYINQVRDAFPDVPGNADYCVYWFRKAHELMKPGARAGLVGTNTIRQNYSRIGGLDYIVDNGGYIYDAVSSMPWQDTEQKPEVRMKETKKAVVHVSIACWSKGEPPTKPAWLRYYEGKKEGEAVWRVVELPAINSALSEKTDVSGAMKLACNVEPKRAFQGQTPGHSGFVLSREETVEITRRDSLSTTVISPYITGDDLVGETSGMPSRFVIDFEDRDRLEAERFKEAFKRIERLVLPDKNARAEAENKKNQEVLAKNPRGKVNHDHQDALEKWWLHFRSRVDRKEAMQGMQRCVVCSRVSKRPIFDFISTRIVPSDKVQTFIFDDDYSFGILQSRFHWEWWLATGQTLKSDPSYVSVIFDTFPWPQNPTPAQVKAVAEAGRALHEFRRERMARNGRLTLRDLYRSLEQPGKNPLKDLHAALDAAVMNAYGFDSNGDVLLQLLRLNEQVAERIERGETVTAPGIPAGYPTPEALVSAGCIQPPELI